MPHESSRAPRAPRRSRHSRASGPRPRAGSACPNFVSPRSALARLPHQGRGDPGSSGPERPPRTRRRVRASPTASVSALRSPDPPRAASDSPPRAAAERPRPRTAVRPSRPARPRTSRRSRTRHRDAKGSRPPGNTLPVVNAAGMSGGLRRPVACQREPGHEQPPARIALRAEHLATLAADARIARTQPPDRRPAQCSARRSGTAGPPRCAADCGIEKPAEAP